MITRAMDMRRAALIAERLPCPQQRVGHVKDILACLMAEVDPFMATVREYSHISAHSGKDPGGQVPLFHALRASRTSTASV
jgi:hypothetical protein